MLREKRFGTTSALLLAMSGCSLLVDTSDLDNGKADAGPVLMNETDGGKPLVPNEAGADATIDAGSTGPWCATHPAKKCIDFDTISDLSSFDKQVTKGSAVVLDSEATSAPHSLYAQMVPNQAGGASLDINLAASPTTINFSFDVRLDEALPYVEFNALHLVGDGDKFCGIEPAADDGVLEINEYCSAPSGGGSDLSIRHALTPIVAGKIWYSVSVALDLNSRTLNASGTSSDGKSFTLASLTISQKFTAGRAEFLPGISYSPISNPGPRVRVDNLRIDFP